jgi:hypothetical protein
MRVPIYFLTVLMQISLIVSSKNLGSIMIR